MFRENSFDVVGVDGSKSGPLVFTDAATTDLWLLKVTERTQGLLTQMVKKVFYTKQN